MADALLLWQQVIAACAPCFTVPSFQLWERLVQGWVLCPGRRTVTRVITMGDPLHQHAHDAYHRFLRAGKWSMAQLWKYLAEALVVTLCKEGDLLLDVDDTLFHKTGRKVEGAGIFRDAVRSTLHKVVYARGLNLVVVTLRIMPPWKGVPLGLPVNMRLHKKDDATYVELAAEMMEEITSWFPTRQFRLNGDGAYASMAGTPLTRTVFTSRMRRDAASLSVAAKSQKESTRPTAKKREALTLSTNHRTTHKKRMAKDSGEHSRQNRHPPAPDANRAVVQGRAGSTGAVGCGAQPRGERPRRLLLCHRRPGAPRTSRRRLCRTLVH